MKQYAFTLCCLLLIGSTDFSERDLTHKAGLMRHAYQIQHQVADQPDRLMDLSADDIQLILAKPDLSREDFPSIVWQFRGKNCVLDIYFQSQNKLKNTELNIVHYEFRSRQVNAGLPEHCLDQLYQDRRQVVEANFQQIIAQLSQNAG